MAQALRNYAEALMKSPHTTTKKEAMALDRALRSCKDISDIDRVWVAWSYMAEVCGWLTTDELIFKNGSYGYYNED